MASYYRQPKSSYWWIKTRDPKSGRIKRFSSKLQIGNGAHFLKLRQLVAELSVKENSNRGAGAVHPWSEWVHDYIEQHFAHSDRSRARVAIAWKFLSMFLDENHIHGPIHLTREHCLAYLPWRRGADKSKHKRPVAHNTALGEIFALGTLMNEAVRRSYCSHNPCRQLGIRKQTPKPKPELTDAEIATIRAAIAKQLETGNEPSRVNAHFLHVSFEIALHQGCRIAETCLDLNRDVDLERRVIRFHTKGDRYSELQMNPCLIPLFRQLIDEGRTTTYPRPRDPTESGYKWHAFLRRIGLKHLSFHSTRVTFVSRLERAGAPEHIVMKMVNHASTLVHRIYRRVKTEEISPYWPTFAADKPAQSGTPDASPANPTPPSSS